jgi:pimeloyl-ACP methyl ester carboxylesterase
LPKFVSVPGILGVIAIVVLLWVGGCARAPNTGVTSLKLGSIKALRSYMLSNKPEVELFRLRGPFATSQKKEVTIAISATEQFEADLYLSAPLELAPLVVFLHGHERSKEDHAYQAMHVATWGMHSLVIQLPNEGPWLDNGLTLSRIVEFIHRQPGVIDGRVDASRIILVGYSFGGSAVAIAMAGATPAAGGILLDPAGIGADLPPYLKQINKPVLMVGADEAVTATTDRNDFFRFIRGSFTEVSVRGANHEDGQFPAEIPMQFFRSGAAATEELQITFVSALTSAALSLAFTGKFDFAWASFSRAMNDGTIINARRK